MRTLATTSALLLAALAAAAQAQTSGNSGTASTPRPARAPLASPDDLEPAVDVGGKRVALIDPSSIQAPSSAPPVDTALAAGATAAPAAKSAVPKTAAPAPKGAAPAAPAAVPAGPAPNPRVVDTLDLGTTSITGNQELPKVLYIVPWKKSDLGDLVGRPVNTLLDEVLEPVDPEVFERHLSYYDALYGKGAKEKE